MRARTHTHTHTHTCVCQAKEQVWKARGFSTFRGSKISHEKLIVDFLEVVKLLRSVIHCRAHAGQKKNF